jgi:hypothetical protein
MKKVGTADMGTAVVKALELSALQS